jgi:hypothetical protein
MAAASIAPAPLGARIRTMGEPTGSAPDGDRAWPSYARRGAVGAARIAARTLRAMLPERAEPGAYRAEWARLLAVATFALPVALIALTLVARAQLDSGASAPLARESPAPGAPAGTGGTPAGGEVAAASADDGASAATGAASGDRGAADGAAVILLTSTVADSLPGQREDDRRLVVADGTPYILNATAGRVDRMESGVARPVLARGQVIGPDTVADLVDLAWLAPPEGGGSGRVVAMDAAGRLWAVDGEVAARVARADSPGWLAVDRMAGYDGNLYALDRGAGQIYRYTPDPGGFPGFSQPGAPWLQASADLAEAADMAIDGAIHVLYRTGRIATFVGGSPAEAGAADPRLATTDARGLYTSPTAGRLLVADRAGGRVLVAAPDGTFEAEVRRSPQALSLDASTRAGRFAMLTDVWWDEVAGVLAVIDGNLLLRAAYR